MNPTTLEAKAVLLQLLDAINTLSYDDYTKKIKLLGKSSIGEHTRHIIELFQQLNRGYENGFVNYDDRKREVLIQENIDFAANCIAEIIQNLEKPDKPLELITLYNQHQDSLNTNYYRELLYNIEHCIHHQAIIKIGFLLLENDALENDFGVAKSTIIYKQNVHR